MTESLTKLTYFRTWKQVKHCFFIKTMHKKAIPVLHKHRNTKTVPTQAFDFWTHKRK